MTASIGVMIKKIGGLVGTGDVTKWEDTFISDIVRKTFNGTETRDLSEKQIEQIERIHGRNFA